MPAVNLEDALRIALLVCDHELERGEARRLAQNLYKRPPPPAAASQAGKAARLDARTRVSERYLARSRIRCVRRSERRILLIRSFRRASKRLR